MHTWSCQRSNAPPRVISWEVVDKIKNDNLVKQLAVVLLIGVWSKLPNLQRGGGGILSVSCNIRQQVFSSQHLSFTSISLLTCLSCRLLMHWCSHPGLTPKYQTRLQFSGLAGWVPDIKINPELRSQMSSAIKKIPAFPRYDFKCYYYSSSLQIYKKTIPNFA